MTATNHALSGAIIGLTITQPAVALSLAFMSHYVLDAIPHFGISFEKSEKKKRLFNGYLFIDAALLAVIMAFLFFAGAGWLVFGCLFLAGSPDFYQAYFYIFDKNFREKGADVKKGWYDRFYLGIQHSSEKGILVEAPLAIVMFIVITLLV